jgi:UTP-glucose-1-phosphate uridylyltransferase
MTARDVAQVVVAAGGLGTRVANWSRFLPKEFYPVDGAPGIVHLLTEIAALGPARVVIVYHPYYEPFIRWAKRALRPSGRAQYQALARQPITTRHAVEDLDLKFVRQHGPYADVTSILNGAARLPPGDLFVAFADNLYPNAVPLLDLATAATTAVLARPFDIADAANRGVIVCSNADGQTTMAALVEKPTNAQARLLADQHGADNLRLLEGRARLTADFVAYLKTTSFAPTLSEPKLSLALASYSRHHRVAVTTITGPAIDLGGTDRPAPALATP